MCTKKACCKPLYIVGLNFVLHYPKWVCKSTVAVRPLNDNEATQSSFPILPDSTSLLLRMEASAKYHFSTTHFFRHHLALIVLCAQTE